MQLTLFDVGHGSCAYLVAANGNVVLFDCGHEYDGFRPSHYLHARCSAIERLVITNFDEDHVSDLPGLNAAFPGRIQEVQINDSISLRELQRLKAAGGPVGPGMGALYRVMAQLRPNDSPVNFGATELRTFRNCFPEFDDTNNLSLVSFIREGAVQICLAGDLEVRGWQALLRDQEFRAYLAETRILVASHHGRESGYCQDVFDYCQPDLILVSDEAVQYETQCVPYGQHCCGIPWSDGEMRHVFTTRQDGHIEITTGTLGGYSVRTWR